jgi:WD40 repeat protein
MANLPRQGLRSLLAALALCVLVAPTGRAHGDDKQLDRERARSHFILGVLARDRDHNHIKSADHFSQAERFARRAGDAALADALRLSVKQTIAPLDRTYRHGNRLSGVAFNRAKTRFLSWDESGTIRWWDIDKDQPLRTFNNATRVDNVVLSLDGTQFLSWGWRGKLQLWDVTSEKPLRQFKTKNDAIGAVFGNKRTPIVSWGIGTIQLWDPVKADPIRTLSSTDTASWLALNADETRIIAKHLVGVTIWDVARDQPLRMLRQHRDLDGAMTYKSGSRVLTWGSKSARHRAKELKVWDIEKDQPIQTFEMLGAVGPTALSRDETRLLGWAYSRVDDTSRVTLWDLKTLNPLFAYKHDPPTGRNRSIQFSHDESRIISWGSCDIVVWSVHGNDLVARLSHDREVKGVALSKNGRQIVSWTDDYVAHVWDVESQRRLLETRHGGRVLGATFDRDESAIVTWSIDGTIRRWKSQPAKPRHRFKEYIREYETAVSPDRQHLLKIWHKEDLVELWDLSLDKPVRKFKSNIDVHAAAINKSATHFILWGKDHANKDEHRSEVWDVKRDQPLRTINQSLGAVAINETGTRCITWTWSGADVAPFMTDVTLWDITQAAPNKLHYQQITDGDPTWLSDIQFTDKAARYLGSCHSNMHVCDITKPDPLWTFSQTYDAQGEFLATNHDTTRFLSWRKRDKFDENPSIMLWAISKNGKHLLRTFRHEEYVTGALFNKDATQFLTWTRSGTARLWDVKKDKPLRTYQCREHTSGARFSSDEKRFLSWSQGVSYYDRDPRTVQLWNTDGKQPMAEFAHDGAVLGARFHRDENFLVSWSSDKKIHLWHVTLPEPLLTFATKDTGENARDVRFDRTGKRLIVEESDGSISVWSIVPR